MADMVSFSIRVNPKVRDEANALFESPGLDFATATRIFYQAAIDCGGFPFEVKKELLNEETIKALRDAERGIGMSEPFDTAAERMEWLIPTIQATRQCKRGFRLAMKRGYNPASMENIGNRFANEIPLPPAPRDRRPASAKRCANAREAASRRTGCSYTAAEGNAYSN